MLLNHLLIIPTSIDNYQKYLQYTRSPVNYSFGDSLYMAPSDMVLQIGKINGYNNKIQVAGPDQKLGLNEDVSLKNTTPDPKSTSDNTDDSHQKDVPTQRYNEMTHITKVFQLQRVL